MKLHDYCQRWSEESGMDILSADYASCIGAPFALARSEGVEALEVSGKEFIALVHNFHDKLPYDWDGKHILGIELIKI